MKLYLIRHTTPKVDSGICYGQTDLDVAETFEQEVQAIQEILSHLQTLPLYSSPLQRCLKLAQALQGANLITDERLMEMNFGDWEMKAWKELEDVSLKDFTTHFHQKVVPNGESQKMLFERSIDVWNEILQNNHPESAIITHYGVIQAILSHLLHIPQEKSFRLDLNYGSIIQISFREQDYYKVKFLK